MSVAKLDAARDIHFGMAERLAAEACVFWNFAKSTLCVWV